MGDRDYLTGYAKNLYSSTFISLGLTYKKNNDKHKFNENKR